MLKDCHRRIEHFLNILCVVVERAQSRTLTADEAAAIEAALNYFRVGGQRHTADEEESLFPRLIAVGGFVELDRFEQDHVEAAQLHDDVNALYRSWISAGILDENKSRRLLSSTNCLRDLYQKHIQVEDNVVSPKAAQVLDHDTIKAIGLEFRTRRQ